MLKLMFGVAGGSLAAPILWGLELGKKVVSWVPRAYDVSTLPTELPYIEKPNGQQDLFLPPGSKMPSDGTIECYRDDLMGVLAIGTCIRLHPVPAEQVKELYPSYSRVRLIEVDPPSPARMERARANGKHSDPRQRQQQRGEIAQAVLDEMDGHAGEVVGRDDKPIPRDSRTGNLVEVS